ncbi:Vegetative incompatibility protein HET-E-1 [Lachnellula suecica]|uniref:Vegetative incompatibility protein HET-E-1 n=1 Tax=Lachnellula suecica TaxID=602035 RepID=A0A8T9CA77_9HELO|nr:Vegetative incompatibility protein HET-E-1 [Lachnellula suecica]
MRLLDVHDFILKSGITDQALSNSEAQIWSQASSAIPRYAILSHRWIDEDEITFDKLPTIPRTRFSNTPYKNPFPQDANSINSPNIEKYASSVYKIAGACQRVRNTSDQTLRHVWIDTVCIDKSNAQELNIAINSMFRWYENAEVCYVYLFDVSWNGANDNSSREQFKNSQWFKRGWTLQELLAPRKLEFFDRDWKYIGSKKELVDDISKVTSISREHLLSNFRSASLAQKMSWLANRETKFPADMSYCMLGVLGVGNLEGLFMDARYSQGTNEFRRLQIEIVKKWDPALPFDESLFAWKSEKIISSGLLAPAPSCFRSCGDLVFEPSLAKLRLLPKQIGGGSPGGKTIGIFFDEANNMSIVSQWILPIPVADVLFCVTFGLLAWVTMLPEKGRQKVIRRRDVALNCWARGTNGQLGIQKIKMEKNKDGSWQRIDCGVVNTSSSSHIYPSRMIAASYPAPLRITNGPVQFQRT